MMFAGCLGGGSGLETSTSPVPSGSDEPAPSTSSAPVTSTPSDPGPQENHAPVAALELVSADGEISEKDGEIQIAKPGQATFDASGSEDADGDALSYEWSVDGEVDPSLDESMITVTLSPGIHTVAVNVSDAEATDHAEMKVHVAAAVVPIPTFDGAALSYEYQGDFDATAMGPEGRPQVHGFVVPLDAHKVIMHLRWSENATLFGFEAPAGNLDIAASNQSGGEVAVGDAVSNFEYVVISEGLVPGTWNASVIPVAVAAPVHYTLDIIVFMDGPSIVTFNGTLEGAQRLGGTVGESTPADAPVVYHNITIPEGVHGIVARLEWSVGDAPVSNIVSDLDLVAMHGEEEMLSSGSFGAFEFDAMVAEGGIPAGEWSFQVSPFLAPMTDYVLVIEYA